MAITKHHHDMVLEVDAVKLFLYFMYRQQMLCQISGLQFFGMRRSAEDLNRKGQAYLIIWERVRASFVAMISSAILVLVLNHTGCHGFGVVCAVVIRIRVNTEHIGRSFLQKIIAWRGPLLYVRNVRDDTER